MNNEVKNYKKDLTKVLMMAAIGAIIGFIFGGVTDSSPFVMAYLGAGVPFGWKLISMIIPFNLIGISIAVLFFWAIKLGISAMIGFFALPILVVYYIVRIVMEQKRLSVE